MYKLTIITAPLSDGCFKEMVVDADEFKAYANSVVFTKGGEFVLESPRSGVIIEKIG